MVFDRQSAIKMSGMSEKAYMRSLNAMKNGIGVKWVSFQFCCIHLSSSGFDGCLEFADVFSCRPSLDVRQLGIQFGCVRLIPFVKKGLTL